MKTETKATAKQKHTPGPWTTNSMTWLRSDVENNEFQKIVIEYSMDATKEQIISDMLLIAAAPELLEAVKEALTWRTQHTFPKGPRCLRCQLEAAVAKAEGK